MTDLEKKNQTWEDVRPRISKPVLDEMTELAGELEIALTRPQYFDIEAIEDLAHELSGLVAFLNADDPEVPEEHKSAVVSVFDQVAPSAVTIEVVYRNLPDTHKLTRAQVGKAVAELVSEGTIADCGDGYFRMLNRSRIAS